MAAWYESIEVYSSDYEPASFEPGPSVEANNDLLYGLRDNDFDIKNSGYTLGLLTLFLVFIVAGVLACSIVPCCYHLLGKSRQERLRERLRIGHRMHHYGGNCVMVFCSVAAVFTAVGASWGLHRTDSGLTNIESVLQDMATDMLAVLNLSNETSDALGQFSTNYELLQRNVEDCDVGVVLTPLLDVFDLGSLTGGVQSAIDDINEEVLDEVARDVQGVSDDVGDTRELRKGLVWPLLSLALLCTVIFVVISIGTYECVAYGHADCDAVTCCVTPCAVFIAVVTWLFAAMAVSMSAISGDFCIDPDAHASDLIAEASDEEDLLNLITYYTGNCSTENFAVEAIITAQQVAMPSIQVLLPVLYGLVEDCEELLAPVQEVDASFQGLWNVLWDAGELSSCENLNGLYQEAVYDELCDDLPRGLLGFWVSCFFLTLLLVVLVIQWNRMLGQQTTEEDASVQGSMFSRRFSSKRSVFSSRGAAGPSGAAGRSDSSSRSGAALAPAWGVGVGDGGGGGGGDNAYPAAESTQQPVAIGT